MNKITISTLAIITLALAGCHLTKPLKPGTARMQSSVGIS